jgi:outer membrane protein TolC
MFKKRELDTMSKLRFLLALLCSLFFINSQAQKLNQSLPVLPVKSTLYVDSLLVKAVEASAMIHVQQLEILQKQEQINREKKGWLSSFRLGVQFLSISTDYQQEVTRVGVLPSLGLSLSIDFERLLTTSSLIRSAKLEKAKAEKLIELQQDELLSKLIEITNSLELSYEQAQIRHSTFLTLLDELTLVQERFKRGELDLSNYLNAYSAVEQAKENYLMAFYSVKKQQQLLDFLTETSKK